jgi:hypothetical protein
MLITTGPDWSRDDSETNRPVSSGLGFVYFVFLPSIITTPLAGRAVQWLGTRPTMWGSLALAIAGLPLLLAHNLPVVLGGMVLVAIGTFFAQATATGFVGRAATTDRGSASGIYLASYLPAAWLAAPSSASCSIGSAGRPASPG